MKTQCRILLALAGLLPAVPAVNAAIVYSPGELIVAFSPSAAEPHTSGLTLLIDIGTVTDFIAGGSLADGNLHTINLTLQNSYKNDLTTAGITDFNAATFSIQGANTGSTLWLSKAETTKGTQATPYTNGSNTTPRSKILIMAGATNQDAAGLSATTTNAAIQDVNQTNSYASYLFGVNNPTNVYGKYTNPEGGLNQVIELYGLSNTGTANGTLLGAFDYNTSTGALRFSSDITDFAAPEPSTLGLAFASVGIFATRRFRRARATA